MAALTVRERSAAESRLCSSSPTPPIEEEATIGAAAAGCKARAGDPAGAASGGKKGAPLEKPAGEGRGEPVTGEPGKAASMCSGVGLFTMVYSDEGGRRPLLGGCGVTKVLRLTAASAFFCVRARM